MRQQTKTGVIQWGMILTPMLLLAVALISVQCCSGFEYEPDNVIEEFTEDMIHYEIDRVTGLPIRIDLSPMEGPEKKPLMWTDEKD